jgi:hypothetical protein
MVPVGVRGARMGRGRGEDGTDVGGVIGGDIAAAARASGLNESLRPQASLQYRSELLGVKIWFSHMAQYCKKLTAMSSLLTVVCSGIIAVRGELAGADRLLNEGLPPRPLKGFSGIAAGEAGEVGNNCVLFMDSDLE